MREILPALLDHLADGPVALARVIATRGSAPREVGSAMAVTGDGQVLGSLSGGCVESAIVGVAESVLRDGIAACEHFGIADPDGFAIGLTCGGELEVFVERIGTDLAPDLRRLADACAQGTPTAWATTLGGHPRRQLVTATDRHRPWLRLDADVGDLLGTGRSGIIGVDDCDDAVGTGRPRTFVHTFASPARLILVGANDFVRALSSLGATLGYRVTVVDARPVFATRTRFPDADEVIVDWPGRYLAAERDAGRLDARTCVCVMTHDPKFDVPALQVALSDNVCGFVGALGSRRTVADRNTRLRKAGVTAEQLAALRSPLGLDLGGHTPAEAAVSIAAQLIAERNAGSGAALSAMPGEIHRRLD
ncbi:MAG: XdhC family protein [Gordonia sp. (in: high G+C Gram-positive bacteria)]